MDALILSLTPTQHSKYLKLLQEDEVALDFEVGAIEFDAYSDKNIKLAKNEITAECNKLMNFAKSDLFFSEGLSQKELEKLIPLYFSAIDRISKSKKELCAEAVTVSSKIKSAEKIHIEISQKYSDFLPYKAALGKNEKYKDEILRIDSEFKTALEKITEQKRSLSNELSRISKLCDDVISVFFERSARAADAPKFKKFNDKDFFASVSSLAEQIKNI